MKIIDLLNQMAKNETVPYRIMVNKLFYYEYDPQHKDYKSGNNAFLIEGLCTENLNDEVEVVPTVIGSPIPRIPILENNEFDLLLALNQERRKINQLIEIVEVLSNDKVNIITKER